MRLLFWSYHIREFFIPEISIFLTCLEKKLLPAFSDTEGEAIEIEKKTLQRLSSLAGPDSDPASIAEQSHDEGVSYYITMKGIEQGILNLFAAAGYHLFEQQLMILCRDLFLTVEEENEGKFLKFDTARERLNEIGIDVTKLESWQKISELRLVANVTKHAEGGAARSLRKVNPSLFRDPTLENLGPILKGGRFLYQPLMGKDFFVPLEILRGYIGAIISFWSQLSQRFQQE